MDEVKIYVKDLRNFKYCLQGARKFFRNNNLDWRDFLKNGIEVSKLEEVSNDAMVQRIVQHARNRKK